MNLHKRSVRLGLPCLFVATVLSSLGLVRCGPSEPLCAVPGVTACEERSNCFQSDNPCVLPACDDGCCTTANAPRGTRVMIRVHPGAGCRRVVCDGAGETTCDDPRSCGDGVCDDDEGCDICPEDCGACPPSPGVVCGDGKCEIFQGESCSSCPGDCGVCCGNGACEAPYETCGECKEDCCP